MLDMSLGSGRTQHPEPNDKMELAFAEPGAKDVSRTPASGGDPLRERPGICERRVSRPPLANARALTERFAARGPRPGNVFRSTLGKGKFHVVVGFGALSSPQSVVLQQSVVPHQNVVQP